MIRSQIARSSLPIVAAFALGACGKSAASSGTSVAPANLVSTSSNTTPSAGTPMPTTARFEGDIVVDVKPGAVGKMPASVTFEIKGDKVRYEPIAAPVRAIDDTSSSHAYLVSDTKKTFSDIDTTRATADKAPPSVRVEKSGKKETVAGIGCEDWTLDDGYEKADVCAARGIAFFDPSTDPKPGDAEPGWARALTKEKAFPLRIVVHDRSGKEEYRAGAFEARWRPVDDASFQVPAGYKKGDLSLDSRTASLP